VFDALSRHLPADAIVTVDVGNHAYSLGRYLESAGQPVLMSGYLGSIGFGFPAAMGAWAAVGGRRTVVAVTGDGGFGQYAMELTTAVKHGIGIKHVLLNNNALGKIAKEQIAGDFPVWHTSLHNPDWAAYAALTRRLIDGGITVITPNGNTGEFYALSQAEARQVVETAASAASNQAELLAGVGHDIATAVEAAGHARDHGARMIMIHQPVHPYVSREGWIDYHAAIAGNVPDLGIVLYLRNERITGADIAALADRAPNVVGVKYGVRDAGTFAAVARDAGIDRFTWLAGAAELTAPAYWACGAHGFTSGLANVTPELPLAMLDALRAGDFGQAMKVWEKVRRFEELRAADASADNVSVVKEALAQLGLCRADVRPPSRPLPPPVKDEISAILTGWGLV